MTSTLVALCLLGKKLERCPTAVERRKVVSIVQKLYTSMKRPQPSSVSDALTDLRAEAKIREIVDLNAQASLITLSQPTSFVTLKEFFTLLRKERCVLCIDHGVYLQFHRKIIHLLDCESVRTLTKRDVKLLFRNTNTVSFVFFE